jgi:predicted phosphoribosyltransferase
MQFKDREQAAEKLAEKLARYRNAADAVIVALPRGGVVLGRIVADKLGLPLDIVVPRKIGAPANEEYAIGAVTESGEAVWNPEERTAAGAAYWEETMRKEMAEAKRRLEAFRKGRPPRDLKGKTAIIVDDGIATGYTMLAAIKTARAEGAKRVVVSVPVAPPDTTARMAGEADELVVLHAPAIFFAIGGFYDYFPQVDDERVKELMGRP